MTNEKTLRRMSSAIIWSPLLAVCLLLCSMIDPSFAQGGGGGGDGLGDLGLGNLGLGGDLGNLGGGMGGE